MLDALSGGDEVVAELCRELNFAAVERGSGLVDSLCAAFTKVREEGLDPASLAIGDERTARAAFEQAVGQLQRAAGEASAADLAHGKGKYAEAISLAQAALEGMTFENFLEPGRWLRLADAVASYRVPPKGAHKESLQALKHGAVGADKQPGLRDFYAGVLVVKHEQAFRTLLGSLEARHRDGAAQARGARLLRAAHPHPRPAPRSPDRPQGGPGADARRCSSTSSRTRTGCSSSW